MSQWTAIFDGQIDLPPSAGQTGGPDAPLLAAVPAKRGIAALLADGDKPLMLLPAADMRSRLRNRLCPVDQEQGQGQKKSGRSADLRSVARKVLWKVTASHFETDLSYLEVSRAIWPKTYHTLLSWKAAWFVHVDAEADYPRLVRTRDVLAAPGRYFGPFIAARNAEAFIGALQDAFELCRDYRCLKQAPNAQPCAYAQMGRCLSPCDGTVSMDQYRTVIARAADFAAGRRVECKQQLKAQMRAAADGLQFESAACVKSRLERLDELDGPAYALVRPVEQFRFTIVQSAGKVGKAAVFLADGGRVTPIDPVDFPPDARQMQSVIDRQRALCAQPAHVGRAERLRMGLISRYLFSGEQRRGLILRWHEAMSPEQLSTAIEESAPLLRLRRPAKRARKEKGPKGGTATATAFQSRRAGTESAEKASKG